MAIPTFFYEAMSYIQRELRRKTTKYNISHDVHAQPANRLLTSYQPGSIREPDVYTVIAALKIKYKDLRKEDLLSPEDVSNLFGKMFDKSGKPREDKDWQGVAEKILKNKPHVVLLLRHLQGVLGGTDEVPLSQRNIDSWQIPEYLIAGYKPVVEKLIECINKDKMESLEPKGVPKYVKDLVDFIEKPENIETQQIYGTPGSKHKEVKKALKNNGKEILENFSVEDVTSALKEFIRDEVIVDTPRVEALINIKQNIEDETARAAEVRVELRKIPFFKLNILIYFIYHLNRVHDIQTKIVRNEMSAFKLARVTAPSLATLQQDQVDIWNELFQEIIEDPNLYF